MDIQKNKATMASFLASILLSAVPVSAQIPVTPNPVSKWHPEPPPVLQKPCIVIDSEKNMTYMIGYDSRGDIVFNFVEQTTCAADWSKLTWTSLPYPGGSKPYHTEQCFLTSTHHFAVQYEGGFAIWDHWARTWTLRDLPCTVGYPNNAALVSQNGAATVDDYLIQWQDASGGHLTGVQFVNDSVYSCEQLKTSNVPTEKTLAASPNDGKSYFLFGPKSSCWYDITAATSPSTSPVQTTSDCHPLPGLDISSPRATNFNGSIYIFGNNNVGVGVWSVPYSQGPPYSIVPLSQGAPIDGNFTVANCGTGIIVYGGCSTPDKCSTNLKPGEGLPPVTPVPPFSIYVPPSGGNNGGGGGGNGGGGNGGGGNGGGGNGGGGNGGGGNGGGGNGGGGNGGGGNGGGGNGGGGNGGGGGGGGGGSWIPPVPTGIPTGIPSGGPTIVPTIGPSVNPSATSSGSVIPTGPGVLPPAGGKTSDGGSHTGAIVGGIIGGLFLIFLIAFMFIFARRRRRQRENEHYVVGGGIDGHDSDNEYPNNGGIPPLHPVGPIGDLDSVVVENKNQHVPIPVPVPVPGGSHDNSSYPGGPNNDSHFPGGPNDGNQIPGGPVAGGGHGHPSNIGKIAAGVAGGAIVAGAIAHHKNDSREEVSHGHVVPAPIPVPNDDESESNTGRGGHVPVPVPIPGGPNDNDTGKQPSGPGGFVPVPVPTPGKTEYSEETTEEVTETIEEPESEASRGRTGLFGGIAAGVAAATAYAIGRKRDDSPEKKTIVSGSTSTTVTTTKTGGRIYTTVGAGGKTVNTEYTETGVARHVLTGLPSGTTTVRTITRRTESGEEFLVPVDGPDGEEREVITERDSNGILRYIIGGVIVGAVGSKIISKIGSGSDSDSDSESSRKKIIITRVTTTTRIITERTITGQIRYIVVGGFNGNAIRVLTERSSNGETVLVPTNETTGELRHVTTERDENGLIKYVIGGAIVGGIIRSTSEQSGGSVTVTSSTRIITERTSTGEIRYVIVGGFAGNAIRVLVERTASGETRLTPTNSEDGELREVITERSESGEVRFIVGGVVTGKTITRVIMGPRIISERTSTGEFRYIIVDEYKGNAIRTKFERSEETGEFVHIPVKEPEGELRYVTEERTESGEIRKVIGAVITGKVATTVTRTEGPTTAISSSSSSSSVSGSQVRIVAETIGSETRYYQITQGADGQEVRTLVEKTEDGGFRIPGGAIIVGAGATLIGNNQTTTTTRVVGGGVLTPAEQAANKTQITLKLSIMRYERADASAAIPNAAIGTVMFSKFKMLAAGDVNISETAYSHVEEVKTQARRTIKWMKTESHWKREAGMLQHLKSDRYITDLYTLYSLPAFAEYRYVSILGTFNCTLESYLLKNELSALQIRQLTASLSDALRWCHDHHVVHLNIRPASFYLDGVPGQDASGQLTWKLWNFGHARFVGEPVDTAVTTVTYAAPEILNGRKKGDANVLSAVSMDRWSLGLIIYEMHARKAYFSSNNFAEFQLTSDDGTKFEPSLEVIKEDDARKAIRGLLEVDAEKRFTYETVREVYFGRA